MKVYFRSVLDINFKYAGNYLYLDGKSGLPGDNALLLLPIAVPLNSYGCFRFHYSMLGNGYLKVSIVCVYLPIQFFLMRRND